MAAASVIPLYASGSTSIGAGLRQSLNIFTNNNNTIPRSIILLSDGQENSPPYIREVVQLLIDRNIRVFTVGLGDGADREALQNLASNTGGDFFFANSPVQLPGIFATLYGTIRNDGFLSIVGGVLNLITSLSANQYSILSPLSDVPAGASSVFQPVIIDSAVGEATFLITWDKGQGNFELTDPNGQSITSDNVAEFSNVEYKEGQGYAFYRVRNIIEGEWHAQFNSDEQEVQWDLKVFGIDNQVQFFTKPEKISYVYPEPVIIQASAMAPQPVIGGHATATIVDPNGTTVQLELVDNGNAQAGDVNRNDGIYSGKVSRFSKDGVYTVTVKFDSEGGVTPAPSNTTGIEFAIPGPEEPPVVPQPVTRFIRYKQFTVSITGVPETIPASVDIDPETLNLKSKGNFITAYIELPQPYKVEDISVPSVTLSEASSNITMANKLPVSIGDHDFDSNPDFMVKFDRAEVISYLRSKGISMQSLKFSVTGELLTGQPFEGKGVVRIIH